jgi:hypothetical protein
MAERQCQMMGWPATSKRGLGTSRERGRKRVPREGPPTCRNVLDELEGWFRRERGRVYQDDGLGRAARRLLTTKRDLERHDGRFMLKKRMGARCDHSMLRLRSRDVSQIEQGEVECGWKGCTWRGFAKHRAVALVHSGSPRRLLRCVRGAEVWRWREGHGANH